MQRRYGVACHALDARVCKVFKLAAHVLPLFVSKTRNFFRQILDAAPICRQTPRRRFHSRTLHVGHATKSAKTHALKREMFRTVRKIRNNNYRRRSKDDDCDLVWKGHKYNFQKRPPTSEYRTLTEPLGMKATSKPVTIAAKINATRIIAVICIHFRTGLVGGALPLTIPLAVACVGEVPQKSSADFPSPFSAGITSNSSSFLSIVRPRYGLRHSASRTIMQGAKEMVGRKEKKSSSILVCMTWALCCHC